MKQFYMITLLGIMITGCEDGPGKYEPKPSSRKESVEEKPADEMESLTESEIEAFMQRWLKVYNTHTYDTYSRLYDQDQFVGVIRPYNKSKSTYNYEGWMDVKRREFKKNMPEVQMNNLRITNLNENGQSKVSFEQVWISYATNYADKGEKVITIRKKNGNIKIVYEELLYSEPADEYLGGYDY